MNEKTDISSHLYITHGGGAMRLIKHSQPSTGPVTYSIQKKILDELKPIINITCFNWTLFWVKIDLQQLLVVFHRNLQNLGNNAMYEKAYKMHLLETVDSDELGHNCFR